MAMRIGFSKSDITPPLGTELGGYAGYRPCSGVHDPLQCKAILLEQEGVRYALIVMDLLCVDEALYLRIADAVRDLGITKERLIVSAIHTHASPRGVVPGEGPLDRVNSSSTPKNPAFQDYIRKLVVDAASACKAAAQQLETFQIRTARGPLPAVGSERHTGAAPNGELTVVQCRTDSGKLLTVYNFPCHPTVMSAANLLVSADFAGGVEEKLETDMAVFVNGAAGDVSTRFTRRESTFAECERMAAIVAEQVASMIAEKSFVQPQPLKGIHSSVTLLARAVETPEEAEKRLKELTEQWKVAEAKGADAATVRTLKSYAEGAGLNLQFARSMGDLRQLHLPVTVFRFAGLSFASVSGELFSALQPPNVSIIGYANGYYRYIGGEAAYEAGFYEALAAIIARGEGEHLVNQMLQLLQQLDRM